MMGMAVSTLQDTSRPRAVYQQTILQSGMEHRGLLLDREQICTSMPWTWILRGTFMLEDSSRLQVASAVRASQGGTVRRGRLLGRGSGADKMFLLSRLPAAASIWGDTSVRLAGRSPHLSPDGSMRHPQIRLSQRSQASMPLDSSFRRISVVGQTPT